MQKEQEKEAKQKTHNPVIRRILFNGKVCLPPKREDPNSTYLDVESSGLVVNELPDGELGIFNPTFPTIIYVIKTHMIRQTIVEMVPVKGKGE